MFQPIYSPLEKLGRILGEAYDIQVVHVGDECKTDGRTIYLPAVPEDAPKEFIETLEGKLDHEVGHVLDTDWHVIMRSYDHDLLKQWTNVCEDARIEKYMTNLWPGCRANLEFLQRFLFDRDLEGWGDIDRDNQLFKVAILYCKGYRDWIPEIPNGSELLEHWEDILPALEKAAEQPDSLHCLALAVWIMDTLHPGWRPKGMEPLKSLAPTEAELKALMEALLEMEGKGTEGEEGEEFEEHGSSGEILRTRMEEYEEEKHGEAEEGPRQSRKRGMLKKLGKALEGCAESGEALSKIAGEMYHHTRGKKGEDSYTPYTTEGDKIVHVEDGDMAWFQSIRGEVAEVSSVMTRRLRMDLTVRGYARTEYEKTWGKLDTRRLSRFLVTGNARCFKQVKKGEKLDVIASLLVDLSGSMRMGKIQEARKAAVLFGEFCDQLGIPFEVLGFTTGPFQQAAHKRWNEADAATRDRFTRWDDLVIYLFKEFHESWKRVGHRIQNMQAMYHNLDAESVQVAAQRLLHTSKPNQRKVLFVFSDGMPEQSIGRYSENQKAHLKKTMDKLEASEIEAIGIGIQTDAPKHYYPKWVSISDPSKLAGTQMEKLRELFQDKKKDRFRM